jgi:hypothetical protein
VLGIGGATNAIERYTNLSEMTNIVLAPFRQWLANNPTKRPNYIVMAHGVPATAFPPYPPHPWPCKYDCHEYSTSYLLSLQNPVRRSFVTHLNMRTPTDCFAYVDKLRHFGTNYSPGISAHQNGYGNSTYYFDDIRDPRFVGHRPGLRQGVTASPATSVIFIPEGTKKLEMPVNVG